MVTSLVADHGIHAEFTNRILEQLGRMAKAFAIEGTSFHPALQLALELLPSRLACC